MAKVRPTGQPGADLVVSLTDPGMTPLLRSGLGGLAASLRAVALSRPRGRWPQPVELGSGVATVEPRRISFSWGRGGPSSVLRKLFAESFRVRRPHRVIDLPGTYEANHPPDVALSSALQVGLKRTFLQHGKTTTKAGEPRPVGFEIDDRTLTTVVQGYSDFAHQFAWENVVAAIESGQTELAGWAYPGAAQRHIAFGATKFRYTPGHAISAIFALVGTLSYEVPRAGAGALVLLEPNDLVQFAVTRPLLTPRRLVDAFVTGPGDALLSVHLSLRLDDVKRARPGVANAHAVLLRTMPWAKQQKSRAFTLSAERFSTDELDTYDQVVRTLPTLIRSRTTDEGDLDGGETEQNFFAATSFLRAFITENLAARKRWFCNFATATTGGRKPRFIHYYRDGNNLGALFNDERSGLIAMLEHLEEAELSLVKSVHLALRNRFGAIASESDNPTTRRNRWSGERDRWRFAFAGAKTQEQIRAALADLWSRAGSNRELAENWTRVLPLLRPEHWQAARDLALVALASYRGTRTGEAESESDGGAEAPAETTRRNSR